MVERRVVEAHVLLSVIIIILSLNHYAEMQIELRRSTCHHLDCKSTTMGLQLILILCLVFLFKCHEIESQKSDEARFASFKNNFAKTYDGPQEEERRFRIFRANLKKIQALNEVEQGTAVYGVTKFADYSKTEFRRYFLGLNISRQNSSEKKPAQIDKFFDHVELPINFDWRAYNAVTPVKNQGMCGSCWAFSVTGNIEGQFAIQHKTLLSFSEQELVDCDKTDQGCNGGEMTDAYEAIEKLGGLELESDYPYEGRNDQCHIAKPKIKVKVSGYKNITANETVMAYWLHEHGPISIALNAFAMQFYFGGISKPLKVLCDPDALDHGVLIVGFGVQRTRFTRRMEPYWLIKNSWGSWWGERGYYKLYRGSGACGVDRQASSAVVE